MKGYVVALAPKQFPFIPAADVLFLRDTIFCFHSSFSLVWITNPCQPTRRKENKSKIVSSRKSIGVRHAKRRSARTYQRLQTISSSIFFGNRLSLVNRWALLGGRTFSFTFFSLSFFFPAFLFFSSKEKRRRKKKAEKKTNVEGKSKRQPGLVLTFHN